MNKRIWKKQQIIEKVDRLLENETFITWSMLGISPYDRNNRATSDAKVVFDYMNDLKIDYLRYSDKYSDKKMHGNTCGFFNDVAQRRKKKLKQIIANGKN